MAELTPSDKYKHMNHFHELTEEHEIVTLGGETFVANKQAIELLTALNSVGLITRTHHISNSGNAFVSILLTNDVSFEVKRVLEIDADRVKYNGLFELLIKWDKL